MSDDSPDQPASGATGRGGDSAEAGQPTGGERPRRRIVLPSSGLAEDILAMVSGDPQTAEGSAQDSEEPTEAWVEFGLDGQSFALPVSHVREVVRIDHITRVPHAPPAVAGITTVWGQPLTVVDLRQRLGLAASPGLAADSRLVVAEAAGRPMGLLVDRVEQVLRVLPSRIAPPPDEALPGRAELLFGAYDPGRGRAVLLDVEQVLRLDQAPDELPKPEEPGGLRTSPAP